MHWFTRPGWPGNLLALLAGTLTTLSLAPFDIWPLALLAVALLYLGLRETGPKQAAQRGWCYGFGLFAAGTWWIYVSIHTYGGASALLAGGLMLAFMAIAMTVQLGPSHPRLPLVLAVAVPLCAIGGLVWGLLTWTFNERIFHALQQHKKNLP